MSETVKRFEIVLSNVDITEVSGFPPPRFKSPSNTFVLATDYAELEAETAQLQERIGGLEDMLAKERNHGVPSMGVSPERAGLIAQLRHDRDVLAENLHDVRSAVWRTGMNAILQRHNEDRPLTDTPALPQQDPRYVAGFKAGATYAREEEAVYMPYPTETEDMSRDIWEGDDFSDICALPEPAHE